MSDFSDRPLYAGAITGLRAFTVDNLGRLRAPQRGTIFTPGENVAKCRLTEAEILYGALHRRRACVPHRVASVDCSCGFYAYTDGRNDFHHPRTSASVEAVIEGYGTATVGTRGFRAEKARLVALVLPRRRRGYQLPNSAVISWWTPLWLVIAVFGLVGNVVERDWISAALCGVGTILWSLVAVLDAKRPRHDQVFDLVRRNYPDVPVYRTRRAALKAHPLPPATPITPETCDDFWTREHR